MADPDLSSAISRLIWESKYRYIDAGVARDLDVADTWHRVARSLAVCEGGNASRYERQFFSLLEHFRFLPGGRILAGAGTGRRVTLLNCFVMGAIEDSMDGIFDALKQGALTMQQGGGVGYDFSTLRPQGQAAQHVGAIASGPVSFMRIWDSMCATILSTGARRGAMMATLRCDHPDIEAFLDVKRDARELRHFNLSVLVTDAFMAALQADADWPLVFPCAEGEVAADDVIMRDWPSHEGPVPCRVYRRVSARGLWQRLMQATYDYAEPGVLFIDRINQDNNLGYAERIIATNPCGEIPLPAFGACVLGSVNLPLYIMKPFQADAAPDLAAIRETVAVAVRLLDNVIDVSHYPLPAQRHQAHASRRIGLGITGLADALVMLGLRYDSEAGRRQAARLMATICHAAYRASIELARERGAFPLFQREPHLATPFVARLPADIRDGIARHGIRNSHLLAIAPTGTISLLAGNVSSGLEPIYALEQRRSILQLDGSHREYPALDYAYARWLALDAKEGEPPFVTAAQIDPMDHLAMQAALQPYVDNAISKTVNIPVDYPRQHFQALYTRAYDLGLKGCTTFRPNPVTGSVLTAQSSPEEGRHCCTIERESD